MSSGYEDTVVIKFKSENIGEVIDYFGDKITIRDNGAGYFIMRARVLINKKLAKWILSFGDGGVAQEPESLRLQIAQTVKKQLELYSDI